MTTAQLLDQFGRPMTRPRDADLLEREATASFGSVRQIQSGSPATDLQPGRLASILRQAEGGDAIAYLELAEQMEERDLHYAAVLGVRKRAIRAMELRVEPGDATAQAKEAAEAVREELDGSALRLALIDMLDAVGKGFSVTEIVWERQGSRWGISALEQVDPRWFEFDQETGRQLYLRDNAGPQELTPWKYVVHMAKAKSGLPIRGGLARLAAWAIMFKTFTLKDWAIFMEAYGHPLRLGKYPAGAKPEDRATLLRAVRQIGVDMAAIIPESMAIEIIPSGAASGTTLYEPNARYWDEQISKGVLGQVATTDAIAGGHAVGQIHEEVRADVRDADAEQLAATLRRDLATPLTVILFGEQVAVPRLRFEMPDKVDPKLLLELARVANAIGIKVRTADVYRAFAITKPEEGEEVLTAPPPSAPPATPPVREEPDAEGSARRPGRLGLRQVASREAASADAVTQLIDELVADGAMQEAASGEIAGLVEALGVARDAEEAGDVLDAFMAATPSEGLRELLARATANARMAGELGAEIAPEVA